MPLVTQIRRNDETLPLKWEGWQLAAMVMAAALDSGKGGLYKSIQDHDSSLLPYDSERVISVSNGDAFYIGYHTIAQTPLNDCEYTLTRKFTFHNPYGDGDGDTLELLPGDVLIAYREF